MPLDDARLRDIRERAEDALGDLRPSGVVGMTAIRDCARIWDRVAALDAGNARASLEELRALKSELDLIAQALESGQHADAFAAALGRTRTVAQAVVRDLARELGEAP